MSATSRDLAVSVTAEGGIRLRWDRGNRTLSLGEAFVIGDSMLRTRKYATAICVFEALSRRHPGNLQVLMMLARCRAGQSDQQRCNHVLEFVLGDLDFQTLVTIQAAFFYEAVGVWNNAVSALERAAGPLQEIPLLRLVLGDYYLRQGAAQKAERCWTSVVIDDNQSSAYMGFLARRRLARLAKRNGIQRMR